MTYASRRGRGHVGRGAAGYRRWTGRATAAWEDGRELEPQGPHPGRVGLRAMAQRASGRRGPRGRARRAPAAAVGLGAAPAGSRRRARRSRRAGRARGRVAGRRGGMVAWIAFGAALGRRRSSSPPSCSARRVRARRRRRRPRRGRGGAGAERRPHAAAEPGRRRTARRRPTCGCGSARTSRRSGRRRSWPALAGRASPAVRWSRCRFRDRDVAGRLLPRRGPAGGGGPGAGSSRRCSGEGAAVGVRDYGQLLDDAEPGRLDLWVGG